MIRYEKIAVKFNNRYLFNNFNLEIRSGEKLLIYGKSGIGKTVLFRLLLGFIFPDAGSIYFDKQLVDGKTVWEVRKKVAYVSQDSDIGTGEITDLFSGICSIKANSHLQLEKSRLKELFYEFDLPHSFLEKNLADLSGGERQRIAIIIALLLKRKVFLLDEATAALDGKLKSKIINYFAGNPEWTVLVISHDKDWLEDNRINIFNLEEKQWKRRT